MVVPVVGVIQAGVVLKLVVFQLEAEMAEQVLPLQRYLVQLPEVGVVLAER